MRRVLGGFAVLAVACEVPPQKAAVVDTLQIRREVRAVFDSMLAGHATHDPEQLIRMIDIHPDFVMAGDGEYYTDPAVIAAGWRRWFRDPDEPSLVALEHLDTRIAVLAPTVAILNNRYSEQLGSRSGDTTNIRGTWALIMVKRGTTWKVLQQYYSHCAAADTVACRRQ